MLPVLIEVTVQMHYPSVMKSNARSAPDCIIQRIQLTADKTQLASTHDLQCP